MTVWDVWDNRGRGKYLGTYRCASPNPMDAAGLAACHYGLAEDWIRIRRVR